MSQWADAYECKFIEKMSIDSLSKLLMATNYLNIPALFELCCASMAAMLKNKQFNKLKKELGTNLAERLHHLELPRYTAAQDEELMQQYPWILEDLGVDNNNELSQQDHA